MSTPGAAGMTPDQLAELKARVTQAVEERGGIRRGESCPNGRALVQAPPRPRGAR
jgi:hypothetical protein